MDIVVGDASLHEGVPVLRRAWRWQRVSGLIARITVESGWLVAACASSTRTPPPTVRSPLPQSLDIPGPSSKHLTTVADWLRGLEPLRRLELRCTDGTPAWLLTFVDGLLSQQTPRTIEIAGHERKVDWRVNVDAFDDRLTAHAYSASLGLSVDTMTAATPGGHAALCHWLAQRTPIITLTLSDDGKGDAVVGALARAGYMLDRRHASRGPLPEPPIAQAGRVRCQLRLTGHGWLRLTLSLGEDSFTVPGSYMASPWHDILMALASLLQGAVTEEPVLVADEPDIYRMHLHRAEDKVSVWITATRDNPADADAEADADLARPRVYPLRELAEAFLAATHNLLDVTPPADLNARWSAMRSPGPAIGVLADALAATPVR